MASMKAIRMHEYGGPDVLTLEEAPRPTAGENEVLVRVHAAAVNPVDCVIRAGYAQGWFQHFMPRILGGDAAGVVEAVGPGVTAFKPGDAVFTRTNLLRDGTYAEYVVANTSEVAAKPRSLDFNQAAAVPHAFLTAYHTIINTANIKPGQTVLIHAAAGGVGHLAVQLAKQRGARVIGTASEKNMGFLKQIGVDQAIDYNSTPFENVVKDVDVVLDGVGGDTLERSYGVLKPGGLLMSIVQPPDPAKAAAHGVRAEMVAASPQTETVLAEAAKLIDAGKIKPEVSKLLPLSEIRQAHALSESRHTRGKIVLQVLQ